MEQEINKPLPLIKYLNDNIAKNDLILDIGCGTKVISNNINCTKTITLDVWKPFNPDIWCNLMTIPRLPCDNDSFDTVLIIDVIEHLTKDRGFVLLKEAKRVARKYIFLLTPLWWDPNLDCIMDINSPYYNNEFDKHLSLWNVDDFIGFKQITSIPMLKNYFFGVWGKNENK